MEGVERQREEWEEGEACSCERRREGMREGRREGRKGGGREGGHVLV